MTPSWQRARRPDEVPTPIAVAVSDFCRRAKAPASAPEVREALSALPEREDFRVRELTDAEPEAQPLGPFAVVDMLRGTSAALAAQRQSSGYYVLVREMLELVEEKTVRVVQEAPSPGPTTSSSAPAHTRAQPPASRAGAEAPPREQSVSERIAPRKRSLEERTIAPEPPPFDKAEPRGRFTRLETQKSDIDALEQSPDGASELSLLIDQHPHRYSLLNALSAQYNGRRGAPLSEGDLMVVARTLKVDEKLTTMERGRLLGALSDQKGAIGRAAWTLGLTPVEFHRLAQSLGIKGEVDEVRERFRREALASRHLGARLDLLGREKYLGDLGIKKRFLDSLKSELDQLLKGSDEALDVRIEQVARDQGVAAELITRAVERLGLFGRVSSSRA